MKLLIKKITDDAKLPTYAHSTDAGMDLYANEDMLIKSKHQVTVPTGIAMAIPQGYAGLVWDKSGLSSKHSLHNLAGVIDAGYRGEIKVVVHNLSDVDYQVLKGQKIAQLLIQKIEQPTLVEVDELDETTRADGGFGSTGLE